MTHVLISVATVALVFTIIEAAKTFLKLPDYVAYSFGVDGTPRKWGSRLIVVLAMSAVSAITFTSVLGTILAPNATLKNATLLTALLVWIAVFQHAMFEATLVRGQQLRAKMVWSIGAAIVVTAYTIKYFIA